MSDRPTPETDAEKINKRDTYLLPETSEWIVTAEFAEKLELQRDSALEELARVRKELAASNLGAERNAKVNQGLCAKLAEAEAERDEARKELSVLKAKMEGGSESYSILNTMLEEALRERDEAVRGVEILKRALLKEKAK